MRIGLFGIEISNINKGVAALGIAQIKLIDEIMKAHNKMYSLVLFSNENETEIEYMCKQLNIERNLISFYSTSYKRIKSINSLNKEIKNLDIAIAITGGDSFSDIYGKKLLIRNSIPMLLAICNKKPLMLAPQTYGPYNTFIGKKISDFIISKSTLALSRDKLSVDLLNKKNQNKIIVGTDTAFLLPYFKNIYKFNNMMKIGVNVSQLLWTKQFSGKKQINLKLDYKTYICKLIENIHQTIDCDIFLVPHVFDSQMREIYHGENDLIASLELKKRYEYLKIAPEFVSPIDAKSFISNMDIFIGSRMHATIAAVSTGVATIPLAYSRKFQGLFSELDYNFTIDAEKLDCNSAIDKTMDYIKNYKVLKEKAIKSNDIISEKLKVVHSSYEIFMQDPSRKGIKK